MMHEWSIALLRPVLRRPQILRDSSHHQEKQVSGEEMEENEEEKTVDTIQRGRIVILMVVRNSPMLVAGATS